MTDFPDNKAYISGRVWLPKAGIPAWAQEKIREETTVRLKPGPYDDGPTEIEGYEETATHLGVPREYYFRTSQGSLEREYNVSEGSRHLVAEVGPRDDLQRDAIPQVVSALKEKRVSGGILCAGTGTGKTVMALLIAAELGLPTLVLVHTNFLLDQWVERIKSDPGVFPDSKVGRFQGDTKEFGPEYDIVIGMVQTLYRTDTTHPVYEWPGLLVSDEVHRLSAPTWTPVAHNFKAAKRLGLTATPTRNDDGEQLFFDAIGPIVCEKRKPKLGFAVRRVETNFYLKPNRYPRWVEEKIMCRDEQRNKLIASELIKAVRSDRKVLVISKRLSQLLILKKILEDHASDISSGVCTGQWFRNEDDALKYITDSSGYQDMMHEGGDVLDWVEESSEHKVDDNKVIPKRENVSKSQFNSAKEADVIFGTEQSTKEAFDVPALDTLFLATPTWDPTQATGRILRPYDDKKDPVVTHFVDSSIPKAEAAWNKCVKKYQDIGVKNL